MSDSADDVTAHVHLAIQKLRATFPDTGFVVISVTGSPKGPVVSMAYNLEDETVRETLTDIVDGKLGDDVLTWQ